MEVALSDLGLDYLLPIQEKKESSDVVVEFNVRSGKRSLLPLYQLA